MHKKLYKTIFFWLPVDTRCISNPLLYIYRYFPHRHINHWCSLLQLPWSWEFFQLSTSLFISLLFACHQYMELRFTEIAWSLVAISLRVSFKQQPLELKIKPPWTCHKSVIVCLFITAVTAGLLLFIFIHLDTCKVRGLETLIGGCARTGSCSWLIAVC